MEGVTIVLNQLIEAVNDCSPNASLLIDPVGNSVVFYKYKGSLVQSDLMEFTAEMIRRRFKYAATRGATLGFVMKSEDDITEFIQPNILP